MIEIIYLQSEDFRDVDRIAKKKLFVFIRLFEISKRQSLFTSASKKHSCAILSSERFNYILNFKFLNILLKSDRLIEFKKEN